MSERESTADIIKEMRGNYYKMGGSNARLDKDLMGLMSFTANRLEAALRIEETQRKELKRRYEIAKTAIREVQDRMLHDGVTAGGGSIKQYWDILEMGFNGTYRNDYETGK